MPRALTSILVPAFRAAASVASVVAAVPAWVNHIVVVDDASPDDTAAVVAALNDPRVILLRHERNRGLGAAMATGYARALELNSDVVIKMDSDGQMDPCYLPALVGAITEGGYGYAKGNRFFDLRSLRDMPKLRLWGSIILSLLTKAASGYWNLTDPQNGYVAVSGDTLRRLDLQALDKRFFFENEMLIQLNILSVPVAEIPMPARYDNHVSTMRLSRILCDYPPKLFAGWLKRMWLKYFSLAISPIAVLLTAGVPLMAWGVVTGFLEWHRSALLHRATPVGTVMLSAVPLILGFQMILQALLMDVANTPRGGDIPRIPCSDTDPKSE